MAALAHKGVVFPSPSQSFSAFCCLLVPIHTPEDGTGKVQLGQDDVDQRMALDLVLCRSKDLRHQHSGWLGRLNRDSRFTTESGDDGL